MSEYLVVADLPTATSKSRAEALRRGCGPVTLYWWTTVVHPVSKAVALAFETTDDKVALTTLEKTALATAATLNAAGWFPAVLMTAIADPGAETVLA